MAFEIRYYNPIHNEDDIEFVTDFICFLGHPVQYCLYRMQFEPLVHVILPGKSTAE